MVFQSNSTSPTGGQIHDDMTYWSKGAVLRPYWKEISILTHCSGVVDGRGQEHMNPFPPNCRST